LLQNGTFGQPSLIRGGKRLIKRQKGRLDLKGGETSEKNIAAKTAHIELESGKKAATSKCRMRKSKKGGDQRGRKLLNGENKEKTSLNRSHVKKARKNLEKKKQKEKKEKKKKEGERLHRRARSQNRRNGRRRKPGQSGGHKEQ